VDAAPVAPGSPAGSRLLCVAAVTPQKGHDLLTEALATVADPAWSCVCVGALDLDPTFVDRLRRHARAYGIDDRLCFAGPRTGAELEAAYAAADLLVLASRGETYGMVVTEALLGRAPDGSLPGLLVRPDDPAALAAALRRWLGDADLRHQLRRSARGRRGTLSGWPVTAEVISKILIGVPA
jgi:glycosyltransferase involved in cell wall biosynthesis